jgi:hypothetical protein
VLYVSDFILAAPMLGKSTWSQYTAAIHQALAAWMMQHGLQKPQTGGRLRKGHSKNLLLG